jgi:hypothetical protein
MKKSIKFSKLIKSVNYLKSIKSSENDRVLSNESIRKKRWTGALKSDHHTDAMRSGPCRRPDVIKINGTYRRR